MTVEGLFDTFYRSTAKSGDETGAFAALERLADTIVGAKLFTLMTFDRASGEARRLYSNMPDAYPISGKKGMDSSDWSRHVLDGRQNFVANDIEGIAEVFPDHELIRSLGCESVVNIPVEVCGEVLGTINCLHEKGYYNAERVEAAEALKLPGSICFLLQRLIENNGVQQ